MAEEIQQEERSGSVIQAILANAYLGGELQAAARQGARELGTALKAFPDSIQVDEPGQVFNPLYRDRDGDMPAHSTGTALDAAESRQSSPSEIAAQSRGSVYGEHQGSQENVQSPSEIAQQSQGTVHGQAQSGQENVQSHQHEHSRGR